MNQQDELRRVIALVEKHERALFEAGADGDPPMIQRVAAVVKFLENGEWALKRFLRIFWFALAPIGVVIWRWRDQIIEIISGL
jgi:hypothetical protein